MVGAYREHRAKNNQLNCYCFLYIFSWASHALVEIEVNELGLTIYNCCNVFFE